MQSNDSTLNVLIVDDEKEACINLKNILTEYVDPEINIVGIAHNVKEARQLISRLNPDAVFLDIEMPNENAFQFLEKIAPVPFEVIFVTAYDEYAIRAFKLNAIDYILKPISISELRHAVDKLKEKLKIKRILDESSGLFAGLSAMINNKSKLQKITFKDGNRIEVVDFKDIYFMEAQGSYSRILFLKDDELKEIVMCVSLTDYEELLPDDLFYRIHKSYLINCSHVKRILKGDANFVVIENDFTLPVSRRRFSPLIEFLTSNERHYE